MEIEFKDIVLALRANEIHSAKCHKGIDERFNRTADEGNEVPVRKCTCWVEEDTIIIVNR